MGMNENTDKEMFLVVPLKNPRYLLGLLLLSILRVRLAERQTGHAKKTKQKQKHLAQQATIPQNYTVVWAGRDPYRSSSPTPRHAQGHFSLEQVASLQPCKSFPCLWQAPSNSSHSMIFYDKSWLLKENLADVSLSHMVTSWEFDRVGYRMAVAAHNECLSLLL